MSWYVWCLRTLEYGVAVSHFALQGEVACLFLAASPQSGEVFAWALHPPQPRLIAPNYEPGLHDICSRRDNKMKCESMTFCEVPPEGQHFYFIFSPSEYLKPHQIWKSPKYTVEPPEILITFCPLLFFLSLTFGQVSWAPGGHFHFSLGTTFGNTYCRRNFLQSFFRLSSRLDFRTSLFQTNLLNSLLSSSPAMVLYQELVHFWIYKQTRNLNNNSLCLPTTPCVIVHLLCSVHLRRRDFYIFRWTRVHTSSNKPGTSWSANK